MGDTYVKNKAARAQAEESAEAARGGTSVKGRGYDPDAALETDEEMNDLGRKAKAAAKAPAVGKAAPGLGLDLAAIARAQAEKKKSPQKAALGKMLEEK